MIRVTHILPSTGLGGVQKNFLFKLKYDKQFNVKRKVICIIREEGELEDKFKQEGIEIINCLVVPTDRNYRPYRLFKLLRKSTSLFYIFKLYNIFRKDKSSIIHSEDSTKLFTQLLVTLFTGKKFIWQLHTNYEVIKTHFFKKVFYYLIKWEQVTLLADSYAAVEANINELMNQSHLFQINSPGIEVEKLSGNYFNKKKLREKYGIKSTDILFGSTGRLHKSKGYEISINCINELINKKGIKCKLLIAGEGPLRSNLIQLINQLELNNNVILLGMVFNIENFLCSLDYYIQSSRNEGFPVATIEALAAKVPVVCTDAGGLPELITDNKSGIVVNKNSITSLVEGICNMLSLTKLEQSTMVNNGLQTANRFSTKRAIKREILVYKSLLNNA